MKPESNVHPYHRRSRARGFTLVELAVVVLIIALLTLLVIPSMAKIRTTAFRARCMNNLKHLNHAVQQYLTEHPSETPPALDMVTGELQANRLPLCPSGGEYLAPASTNDVPTCTFGQVLGHSLR